MRKVLFVLLAAILMVGCEKETVLSPDKIPAEITTYVKQHFPNNPIIHVIKDKDNFSTSYNALLEGNFKLEFNGKKEVKGVESVAVPRQAIPESVLQAPILSYLKANYPKNFAVKWEMDDRRQEVELDNNLSLEFDLKGNLREVDI